MEARKSSLVSSNLDETDAFTISTFSYYGQPYSPTSPSSPTSTMPPSSPAFVPPSLPPPPRRFPRQSPSSSSVRTAVSNSSTHVSSPQIHADEVHPDASAQLSSPSLETLHERGESSTLGVPGGSILVTVHRQASFDRGT